ncbi:hypothetical protein PFICI_01975 [Pestalotiopsis fici W106-1]|uniref:Uncharacterized protein n=1 Tax=Pestalotiopsis fici (strain W106-1 / CGMCC3.15140) TaxID=1229662 RepID=W3XRL3_PESFW|nr:uncharacterized protein PFICI_01975 [Pestalotiopsis fici W106-1]ETS88147.1 hypothetical protein PFICI_01975 [Pestalotiopsis fici W106-1]
MPKKSKGSVYATLSRHFEDSWTSEIMAMSFSGLCLIAMVIVLREFDGRPVPELPDIVNLNAIVSTLSAAAKSSLLYGVSAALGQAKWSWYYGPKKRLDDFEVLDEASKGPLGSVQMLLGRTIFSVGSLGAIVIIIALALDPFVQQVILVSSDPVSTKGNEAWTGIAFWNRQAIYERTAHCPTGNCTWDPFSSLGWCVKSQTIADPASIELTNCDIAYNETDFDSIYETFASLGDRKTSSRTCEIHIENATTPLNYPIQFSLSGGRGPLAVNLAGEEPDRVTTLPVEIMAPLHIFNGSISQGTYLGVNNPIVALGHARFSGSDINKRRRKPEILEHSVISLCQRKYNVSVVAGQTLTQILETHYGHFYQDEAADMILGETSWCWTPGQETPSFQAISGQFANTPYLLDSATASFCTTTDHLSLGSDIVSRLASASTLNFTHSAKGQDSQASSLSYHGANNTSGEDILNRISSQSLGNITGALSEALNSLYYDDKQESVSGHFITYQATVHVRWEWMTLPIFLEVLGIIFMLIVMFTNRRRPLWKGSTLATLYHGLEYPSNGQGLHKTSGMREMAQSTRVNLRYSDQMNKMTLQASQHNEDNRIGRPAPVVEPEVTNTVIAAREREDPRHGDLQRR